MEIFQELHHACIVVNDIGKAVAYHESVGIGPWHDYPPLTQVTHLDVPDREAFLDLTYKWANIRNMQLQLCEPGPGDTPQRRFFETRGEGVHHLGFVVPNCDAAAAEAVKAGLTIRAKGQRDDAGGFTYFDIPGAPVTLEIRTSPTAANPKAT